MFSAFLNDFWGMIQHYIDMLKSSDIADLMFGGVTLWSILISLFCTVILLRFFLNPVSGGGLFKSSSSSSNISPQVIDRDVNHDVYASKSDKWGVKMK